MFKTMSKGQVVGLLLAVAACCILVFGKWHYTPSWSVGPVHMQSWAQKDVHPLPDFRAGLVAIAVVAVCYLRGLFNFRSMNRADRLVTLVVYIAVVAVLCQLFAQVGPVTWWGKGMTRVTDAILLTFVVTMLLFGMRHICKLAIMLYLLSMTATRVKYIDEALGFWGFVVLVLLFASIYLQDTISRQQLTDDFRYLYRPDARHGSLPAPPSRTGQEHEA